jgi:hypothetical protein
LSGVKTVHLPDPDDILTIKSSLNIRLHFPSSPPPSSSSSLNFEAFSSSAKRIFRLELTFLHGHVQINWDGFLSSWHNIHHNYKHQNHLEIKLEQSPSPSPSLPKFKLNEKVVKVHVPEPVIRSPTFKLTYDELAVPDSDWFDLVTDPEILNSLQTTPPNWKSPLISAEPVPTSNYDDDDGGVVIKNSSLVDYIVYDCESFVQLQISSGIPLPKVVTTTFQTSYFNPPSFPFKSFLSIFKSSTHQLPAVIHGTTKKQINQANTRILGTFAISAFLIYLAVLLHLSKMTSIRPGNGKKLLSSLSTTIQPLKHMSISHSHSHSHSHSQLKLPTTVNPFKSPSRSILIDLPETPLPLPLPLLSLSNTGSVLKVSVPAAALSLADNRHILFPSKLRK